MQSQLLLRVKIPVRYRAYAIYAIEEWFKAGYKWHTGRSMEFAKPAAEHMKSYKWIETYYDYAIQNGLEQDLALENAVHPSHYHLLWSPKELARKQKALAKMENDPSPQVDAESASNSECRQHQQPVGSRLAANNNN